MQKASFLPKLAVTRPVTIIVTLAAIIVVGAIAYLRIPTELLPSGFEAPFMGVWVPYTNANPEEVEEQIARPVEEQLRTISGIENVESYSHSNGCWIWLELAAGADVDLAYDQLRDRMERARASMPEDLDRYYLRRFGRNDEPIIFLSVAFPESVDDPNYLVEYLIKRPIERIDGIGAIEIWGTREKNIQIMVDQDKIRAHNLNMYEVTESLRNDNFAMSSGWVEEGEKKFLVRSVARFGSLEEIANIPLNQNGLRLKDVAKVSYEPEKRSWTQRINSKQGVLVEIQKESLANTVELSRTLKGILENDILRHPKLADADVELLFVQGEVIEEAVDNLKETALWGGLFSIFILFFFLRNLRMTIIMMFAIPLSVLISLIAIYFIGWTINVIVMMGLMISVGMVVDNGIVVLENIYRRRSEGDDAKSAAVAGASEVNLAIIMATLTTIFVFVPMLIIRDGHGGFNFYMQRIGLPVIFALLASLFVALVLIPLATTQLSDQGWSKESSFILWMKGYYERLLQSALHNRMNSIMVVIAIFVVTFGFLMPNTPSSDSMDGNINDIRLIFDLPSHFTQEDAEAFFVQVEDTIQAKSEEYQVKTIDTGFRRGFGRVRVYLEKPPRQQWFDVVIDGVSGLLGLKEEDPMTREEVLADLKERVQLKPGIEMRTSWRRAASGGDGGSVSINLYGDDTGTLAELAEEVKRRMRTLDGVQSVETDSESGDDEIRITMDREMVTRNGINPNQVAYTLMYAVRGINLPRFQAYDKEIEIRVQYQEEDRENLSQLKNITFQNDQGQSIPLSAIASFQIDKGFGQIARENGKTFLAVKANTTADDLPRISGQIDALMKDFKMPYGYDWQKGSRFRNFGDQGTAFVTAMILAIIFVYLIMAILFESFIIPISIILAIPLSFFGAYFLLWSTGTTQDLMSGIGITILAGVVVNNGIVLVDMVIRRRREGFSRSEAILDAGRNRLRPILMTSFTTICGLIPMALGSGNLIGIPYAPMGRAIVGGMLTSTFLTLIVVPVFYSLLDDMVLYFHRYMNWLNAGRGAVGIQLTTSEK